MAEDFFNIAIQNGFSIAVAAFLLIKVDARIEELTKAVTTLVAVIDRMEQHRKENGDGDK